MRIAWFDWELGKTYKLIDKEGWFDFYEDNEEFYDCEFDKSKDTVTLQPERYLIADNGEVRTKFLIPVLSHDESQFFEEVVGKILDTTISRIGV